MPRLTIQFGEKTDKLLRGLAKEKGTSMAEIIRRALITYKYFDNEIKDGTSGSISIISKEDKTVKDVILP